MRKWIRAGFAACVLAPAAAPAEGDELQEPVRLEAGGKAIDTGAHVAHAGPLFADYDGDGRKDLLVGNFHGYVQVYRNAGTNEAPSLVDEGLLQAAGKPVRIHNW